MKTREFYKNKIAEFSNLPYKPVECPTFKEIYENCLGAYEFGVTEERGRIFKAVEKLSKQCPHVWLSSMKRELKNAILGLDEKEKGGVRK